MYNVKKSVIALAGLLALVATFVSTAPLVGHGQGQTPFGLRRFYLTNTQHNGSEALTACAKGYHMASLFEIFDPSNLKYDTALGLTTEDSGFGPPKLGGWIRTGNLLSDNSDIVGQGNCNVWSSSDILDHGTEVRLPVFWEVGEPTRISPWDGAAIRCNAPIHVWCVQD